MEAPSNSHPERIKPVRVSSVDHGAVDSSVTGALSAGNTKPTTRNCPFGCATNFSSTQRLSGLVGQKRLVVASAAIQVPRIFSVMIREFVVKPALIALR